MGERRSNNKILDGGMMMGLGKRSPLAAGVPLLIELGKKSGYISDGGMRAFGKRRQNFISDGGMMMGLGKRAPRSISDGGMMMGLGKRAASKNNFISNGGHIGMMMGLGKRSEEDYDNGIEERHVWQPVFY